MIPPLGTVQCTGQSPLKEGGPGPRCPCCRDGENLDSSERGAEGKTWSEVVEAEAGPARRAALKIVISLS